MGFDEKKYILADPVGKIPLNYYFQNKNYMISSQPKYIAELEKLNISKESKTIKKSNNQE